MSNTAGNVTWNTVEAHLKKCGVDTEHLVNVSGAPVCDGNSRIYDIPLKQKDELNGTFACDPDHSSFYKVIVDGETWVGNAVEKKREIKRILTEIGLKDDKSGAVPFNLNGFIQLTDDAHAPLLAKLYGESDAKKFRTDYFDTAHVIALGRDNLPPTQAERDKEALMRGLHKVFERVFGEKPQGWKDRVVTPADYQSGKFLN